MLRGRKPPVLRLVKNNNTSEDEIPVGLSLSFLKGSMEHMERILNSSQAETYQVHRARVQLSRAFSYYEQAAKRAPKNTFIFRKYEHCARSLVRASYTILATADEQLLHGVKLLSVERRDLT